jgi:hypothetical protein
MVCVRWAKNKIALTFTSSPFFADLYFTQRFFAYFLFLLFIFHAKVFRLFSYSLIVFSLIFFFAYFLFLLFIFQAKVFRLFFLLFPIRWKLFAQMAFADLHPYPVTEQGKFLFFGPTLWRSLIQIWTHEKHEAILYEKNGKKLSCSFALTSWIPLSSVCLQ